MKGAELELTEEEEQILDEVFNYFYGDEYRGFDVSDCRVSDEWLSNYMKYGTYHG